MKALVAINLCLLCPLLFASKVGDPFDQQAPAWVTKIQEEKTYLLEMLYGESASPLPEQENQNGWVTSPNGQKKPHISKSPIITEVFLKSAKKTSIAISLIDNGIISREDGVVLTYRIDGNQKEIAISLLIYYPYRAGGFSEINTSLTLWPQSERLVIGDFLRAENGEAESTSHHN